MKNYDVVIVGGGIQGVGVAQAAAAEGYSVLLLEKSSLAHGTSSKSSKLIHGGLRYLENAEFSLVRESLHERKVLLEVAPDLVRMKRFIIPVYKETRRAPWQIRIGLSLYYALANFRSDAKPGKIPRKQWDQLDGLRTRDLRAVFYYSDAQTDDRLLTEAVMASAQSLDAELAMPAKFTSAQIHDEGVEVHYSDSNGKQSCTGNVLINAAGPWVNKVAHRITPTPAIQKVELVGGTHIILDGTVTQGIYYTESPRDGRAVFILPWYDQIMVGTTERTYRKDPDLLKPSRVELNYLMNVLKHYFPAYARHTITDITEAWAGLRVLPAAEGHAFKRSREVIFRADQPRRPRVLAIYGGKLTGYRATAQRVMKRIRASLPTRQRRADTAKLPLPPNS
ncbi:MAG: FAD-dependent oxidoreductase [Gammaproteobacteria bacterium]|nr:FAD-dependent oxidoreductase [Gammaproteobacteria bacterium]